MDIATWRIESIASETNRGQWKNGEHPCPQCGKKTRNRICCNCRIYGYPRPEPGAELAEIRREIKEVTSDETLS